MMQQTRQTLNVGSGPLQKGVGSLLGRRQSGRVGHQPVSLQTQPTQFGQLQGSSGPRPPSLEEVLSQRGFTMPEKPRISSQDMAFLGTDPVTGRMRQGGSTDRGYYKKLDEMYAQNPEALEIAKQYTADPTQFGGEKPTDRGAALGGQLNQTLQQEMPRVFGNQPQQVYGPSLDPAQLQQEQAALSNAQASAAGMPPPQPVQQIQPIQRPGGSVSPPADLGSQRRQQPVQQIQPIQRPSFQSLQQPMGQQQPQFTQQDMGGMMRLMMQMFQQMMQGGMGQQSYNSGAFNNAPSNFYPQYPSAPQQSYAPPPQRFAPQRYQAPRPQPYRMRQFSGSPFGR